MKTFKEKDQKGMLPNLHTLRRRIKSHREKGRHGLAALEFALIAPVFLLFLLGITELSLIMMVQHLLESAMHNASRTGKTGYVEAGKTQMDTVMDSVLTRLGGLSPLVDVSKLTITSTAYGDLSQIGQPEQGSEGLGTAEQVVVYTITYPWKMFTPVIGNLMGDENHIINLSSRIVVRNEPYE